MAARGRRISGIYVPIQLDTSAINGQLQQISGALGVIGHNIQTFFQGALNPRNLITGLVQTNQALGNIRDSARALQSLRVGGAFEQSLQPMRLQLQVLARTLGITEEAQKKLLAQMARTTAINQQVQNLRTFQRQLGLTEQQALQFAQSLGMVIDRAARLQYLGSQGRGILGAFSPSNMTAGIQSALGAMGVVGGMYGVVELGKSMAKAALQMDNIKIAFESIYGSASKAEVQLQFVRQVSDNLGLSFVTAAAGAKKLFAAIENTEYASSSNKVFQAFANAGAALKLTNDEMNSIYLAVSQIYSKGKVSAEELRQQLAERLPGAVTLFAQSIGVTTRELDKMLKDGAVGLEHMEKFADALQEKYSVAAAAASTGLQAELNRVSSAWFDLKRAFVNTEGSADLVRKLGSALKYLGDNAASIAAVVKELLKFGAISGGAYIAITAIQKLTASISALWKAAAAGNLMTMFASTGPAGVGIGALALGIGGLVTVLTSLDDGLSESDKQLKKFGEQTFDLEQAIRSLGGATEYTKEKMLELQTQELERQYKDAKKALDALFAPSEVAVDTGPMASNMGVARVVKTTKNEFDKAFDELGRAVRALGEGQMAVDFEASARSLAQKFRDGFNNNLSPEQLNSIALELHTLQQQFKLTIKEMGDSKWAQESLLVVNNMLGNAITLARKWALENQKVQKSQDGITEAVAQSEAAYDAITKLTKRTPSAKENKLESDIKAIAEQLVVLYNNSQEAQARIDELGESADRSSKEFVKLLGQTQSFEQSLPLIADLAIQSGFSFDKMSDALDELFYAAKITHGELLNLKAVLSSFMNMKVGEGIGKAIDKLQNKAKMAKATGVQKTLVDVFTKAIPDTAKKGQARDLILGGKWDELKEFVKEYKVAAEEVDKARRLAEEIDSAKGGGRKRGGGRSRSGGRSTTKTAAQQMSEATKEADNLTKKIAALQAQYQDDPSIKYWADVEAELKKVDEILANKMSKSTEAEKANLAGLRGQYEMLAKARYEQMKQEEQWQKQIEAASKFGKGYGNLSDVSGTINPQMQIAALKAEYEQMVQAWKKALDDQTVSYEQYVQGIADLTNELRTKTEAANGGMVANFADHVNQSYEKIKDWQSEVSDILMTGVNSMSSAFATFFIDAASGTEDLQKAFSNMVKSMINSLADLFMQMVIIGTLKKVLGLGDFASPFQSGAKNGTNISSNPAFVGPMQPSAKGNVFSGIGSFSGKVVKGPTIFSHNGIKPFARGAGLMGEAGWEAVMPLVRTKGGNLGVRAEGGGGSVEMNQDISINIINNSDSEVSAKKSRDNNGNVSIEVMIEKMVGDAMRRPGSAPFRALQDTYGATTVLAKR